MFSEVVLDINRLTTPDGKRPTISSDANYCLNFFFMDFFSSNSTV